MPMARNWNGLTIQDKTHRAAGRAIVGIGVQVAVDAKRLTHVISGTLSRSIHVAPAMASHDDDQELAESGADLLMASVGVMPEPGLFGPVIEVGSWLDYACVEWVGRNHPGITQAMEAVRGARANSILWQAWYEEGLAL